MTVIEAVEPPHSPPPVFTRHAFIEMFLVVKGALTFQFLHESAFVIEASQMVTVPGYRPHSFWNEGDDPAGVMLICTPAGLDRFFEASDRLLRRMPTDTADPDELKAEMARLRKEFGLEHVAPAPK
ncbi:MAG: cupin domain-containing protein [Gemmatimonadetes bacterium]|nr:cupin domain-containing protein [Gemmatimonadota bacterium]